MKMDQNMNVDMDAIHVDMDVEQSHICGTETKTRNMKQGYHEHGPRTYCYTTNNSINIYNKSQRAHLSSNFIGNLFLWTIFFQLLDFKILIN